jgi:hypothetical protein
MGISRTITPWDVCRVAFRLESNADCELTDMVWARLQRGSRLANQLPRKWSLHETNNAGCQTFVVFEVEGIPTPEDGEVTKHILNTLVQKVNRLNP